MFAANHYVKVAGKVYVAGEILPEMPEEKAEWLLSAGAIREVGPAQEPEQTDAAGTQPEGGDAANNQPEGGDAVTPEPAQGEEAAEETPEEELDEEAEPEEIDVMAGIVTETKPAASKGTTGTTAGRKRK